jgi:hypothetical protein
VAASDDDRVELTELDVITRYSLAVRSATAQRAELIEALRNDLAWLESSGGGRRRTSRSTSSSTTAKKTSSRSTRTR